MKYYDKIPTIIVEENDFQLKSNDAFKNHFPGVVDYQSWMQLKDLLINDPNVDVDYVSFPAGASVYQITGTSSVQELEDVHVVKNIIDAIPEAVLIIQDKRIVMTNTLADQIVANLEGGYISDLLADSSSVAEERLQAILETGKPSKPFDYKVQLSNGSIRYFELSSNFILYQGEPAVLSIARDVTYKKFELNEASRVTQIMMNSKVPTIRDLELLNISVPSKTVSGDFYFYEKVSDHKIIGILGDVKGKGISAAMRISALEMLFRDSVEKRDTLETILDRMNKKVMRYFDDVYVAALLFSIDSEAKEAYVTGAGINEFISLDKQDQIRKHIVKGPFLGMFEDLAFDIVHLKDDLKRVVFYTDGFLLDDLDELLSKDVINRLNLNEVNCQVNSKLKNLIQSKEGLLDDCTMLIGDINFVGTMKEYVLKGLSDYKIHIPRILEDLYLPTMEFRVHLVLMELITNAYKYGNKRDPELPIKVSMKISGQQLSIEVVDMNLTPKNFNIKEDIKDDELLDDNGRGLFIVKQMVDSITVCERSIVVEMSIV